MVRQFLDDECDNKKLFISFLATGNSVDRKKLDQRFKIFYFQRRFISYISQVLYFEALHYDQHRREDSKKVITELDKPINEEGSEITKKDLIIEEVDFEFEIGYREQQWDFILHDEQLIEIIKKLADKQKTILFLFYVCEWKDREIAELFSISQQAISKNRNKALAIVSERLNISSNFL